MIFTNVTPTGEYLEFKTEDGRRIKWGDDDTQFDSKGNRINYPPHYMREIFVYEGKAIAEKMTLRQDWFFFVRNHETNKTETIPGNAVKLPSMSIFGAGETPEEARKNGAWYYNQE